MWETPSAELMTITVERLDGAVPGGHCLLDVHVLVDHVKGHLHSVGLGKECCCDQLARPG